jgi:chemosensory pili system protein ChpB (putative protein-glutamate methylesterase)
MSGDAMTGSATRVALLARNGAASERLQAALREAGADVVLVCDPSETDVSSVRATGAQALLIALEPAVEESLDRFDALLADPDVTVIFDEAELAAQRQGWDAARWTRHLAAKLNRHDQVLPPGAEIEAALAAEPEPLAVYRRPENDGDISAFAIEAENVLAEVPSDFASASGAASMFDPVLAEMDGSAEVDFSGFPGLSGFSAEASLSAETDTAPPAASGLGVEAPALVVPDAVASRRPPIDPPAASDRFRRDLDELELRIADMQLEDVQPVRAAASAGAVVVLAGLGGPDAVRQLLGELPDGFSRPVLVQQRLEGGRHDKLVRQMQRATNLPVTLVEPGMPLQPGHIYVLTADVGVESGSEGLRFGRAAADASDATRILANLRAGDSAIVMLSGSDPAMVDAAMNHAGHGAFVAGQSTEGCFDAAAAEALIARGAEAGTPAQLAQRLAARWPSPAQGAG